MTDTDPFPYNYVALVPRITGGTSVTASATLIYLIMRSDAKLFTVYHRIMFGMSIFDILGSTAIGLSSLPMPRTMVVRDPNDIMLRLGNDQTCQAQGFFFTFGIVGMFAYNGTLCIYYACVLAFRMKEQRIIKRVEPLLHLTPVVVAFLLGIPPFFFDPRYHGNGNRSNGYRANSRVGWCALSFSDIVHLIYYGSLIFFLLATILSCFGLIIWRIRRTRRILQNVSMISTSTGTTIENDVRSLRRRGQILNNSAPVTQANHVSKVIFVQAFAYISAFFITMSTPLIRGLIKHDPIWLVKLQYVIMPLQGLFNLMIYIGHRIYNYRRVHPDVTKCEVFRKLFTGNANDDVLFTRISLLEINDNDHDNTPRIMNVRLENEYNEVEDICIQLEEKKREGGDSQEIEEPGGGLSTNTPGRSTSKQDADYEQQMRIDNNFGEGLSSIHMISEGTRDEFSTNDFALSSFGARSSMMSIMQSQEEEDDDISGLASSSIHSSKLRSSFKRPSIFKKKDQVFKKKSEFSMEAQQQAQQEDVNSTNNAENNSTSSSIISNGWWMNRLNRGGKL